MSPDHPTPLATRTHSDDPGPFVICPAPPGPSGHREAFDEEEAGRSGIFVEAGHLLLGRLLGDR